LKKGQDKNNTREEEESAKRTKKRRPTKVGLNDTLRRIRHLMIEGRSNLEIQNILQLEERTFYRYMAKIHQIDQVLFAEQEKKNNHNRSWHGSKHTDGMLQWLTMIT
jgi:DNA-binding CsgD family transcriptional regulator